MPSFFKSPFTRSIFWEKSRRDRAEPETVDLVSFLFSTPIFTYYVPLRRLAVQWEVFFPFGGARAGGVFRSALSSDLVCIDVYGGRGAKTKNQHSDLINIPLFFFFFPFHVAFLVGWYLYMGEGKDGAPGGSVASWTLPYTNTPGPETYWMCRQVSQYVPE